MNLDFLNNGIIHSLGMTLLHSLWQIVAIYILLRVVLSLLKASDSRAKYNIAGISMILVLFISILTFSFYHGMETKDNSLLYYSLNTKTDAGNGELLSYPVPLANEMEFETRKGMLDYIPWFVLLYFTGILFLSIRLIFSLIYLGRYKRTAIPEAEKELESLFRSIKKVLRVKRKVKIIESALCHVPFVLGYLKPLVIVPLGLMNHLPFNQVEAIFAHELAHIKRHDYFINIFQSLVEILFFYHPVIYLISRIIRNERENCCDDIALNYCKDSKLYVKALANMESRRMNIAYPAVAFVKKKNNLLERITRILKPNLMKTKLSDRIYAGLIIVAGLSTILVTGAAALNTFTFDEQLTSPEETSIVLNNLYEDNTVLSDSIIEFDEGRIITHRKNEKGKDEKIEMIFDQGELTYLSVNGEEVPKEDHYLYKDVVKETLVDVKEAQDDIREAKDELADFDADAVRMEMENAMEELEAIKQDEVYLEVEKAMKEVKAEIAEIDYKAIRAEVDKALSEIDVEEIRREVDEAMEEIDSERLNAEVQSAMESVNWEEIQKEIEEAMKEAKMSDEELKVAMDAAREGIEAIDWNIIGESIELGLGAAFESLEGLDEIISESLSIGLEVSSDVLENLDETIAAALKNTDSIDVEKIIRETEQTKEKIEKDEKKLNNLEEEMEQALEELEKED